ncbi:MAG: hypothetical protein NWR67_03265 [Saprospiraceae bacterium]|nr:hypothetical protein [Saprospiraceae bacterium]MDP4819997.1 hypothetical protein [Saprospiraceae bacterium]MDP4998448.1 hypothetical protein [Saprospiraceae bacterium]
MSNASDDSLLDAHGDFFSKAAAFASGKPSDSNTPQPDMAIEVDPDYQPRPKTGTVPGFEDLDGDGNELVDDAILDND